MWRVLLVLVSLVALAPAQDEGAADSLAAIEAERLALQESLSGGAPAPERAAALLEAARAVPDLPPWYLAELEGLRAGIVAAAALEPTRREEFRRLLGQERSLEEHPQRAAAEIARARDLLAEVLGPEHPCTLRRDFLLASHSRQSADWERAEALLTRTVERAAAWQGAGGPEHARQLMNLGWHLFRTGRTAEAEEALAEAIRMARALGLPQRPLYRRLWMWLTSYRGSLTMETGELSEARSWYMASLGAAAEIGGRDSYVYVMGLNNLATCHMRMLDYRGALALQYECVERATAADVASPSDLASMWFNLGASAQSAARPREAIRAYGRVRELMEGRPLRRQLVALAEGNRAILAMSVGEPEIAAESGLAALEEYRALGAVPPSTRRSILEALIFVAIQTRDLERARALCDDYEEDPHPGKAAFYRGAIAMRDGELEAADAAFRAAIRTFTSRVDEPRSWLVGTHTERGRTLLELGRRDEARDALCAAAEVFEGARERLAVGFGRAISRATPHPLLARIAFEEGDGQALVQAVEAASARSLGDLLAPAHREAHSEGARLADELEVTLEELRRAQPADGSAGAERVTALELRILGLRRRSARSGSVAPGAEPLSLAALRDALAPDEAFVGWFDAASAAGRGAAAWVVTAKDGAAMVPVELPAGTASFRSWIDGATRRLGAEAVSPFPAPSAAAEAAADAAGRTLLGGLVDAGHLAGIEHLHVAGSALGAFPLEAVRVGGRWAEERWTVSYAPSCSLAVRLAERPSSRTPSGPPGARAVIIADPDVTGSAELPSLPASRREARAVAEVLGDALVLTGEQASEGRVRELARSGVLGRATALHFATHALVDDRDLAYTRLVLARVGLVSAVDATLAGTTAVDGDLSVPEILSRFRLDADLVTLSTCRSGLGVPIRGEGHVGLVAAFLQAGARSVVSSRWEVQDGAAAQFMGEFYRLLEELDGPRRKARALAGARRFLRDLERDGTRPFAHPGVWAAFTLTGCP